MEGRSKIKGGLSLSPHYVSYGVLSSECFSSPLLQLRSPCMYWEIPSWLYIHDGSNFFTLDMPPFTVLPAQRVVDIFCCGSPQVKNLHSSLSLIPEIQAINKTTWLYLKNKKTKSKNKNKPRVLLGLILSTTTNLFQDTIISHFNHCNFSLLTESSFHLEIIIFPEYYHVTLL